MKRLIAPNLMQKADQLETYLASQGHNVYNMTKDTDNSTGAELIVLQMSQTFEDRNEAEDYAYLLVSLLDESQFEPEVYDVYVTNQVNHTDIHVLVEMSNSPRMTDNIPVEVFIR